MADTAESRLKELGVELPPVPPPAASYIPAVRTGNLIYVSGQVSAIPGKKIFGKLGADMSLEEGQEAARVCAINVLANLKESAGGLENIKKIVKVVGFVNCTPDFEDAHKVINGGSDFLAAVLGERGQHARSAIGMVSLPLGYAVEIEAIAEVF
jgi:enamine deaminase RidA (YjgF/YER057c/UK114 family)